MSGTNSDTIEQPFPFLDLPQELQEKIIKHYWAGREVTLNCGRGLAEGPLMNDCPSRALLCVNKDIYLVSSKLRARTPTTLKVDHDIMYASLLVEYIKTSGLEFIKQTVTTLSFDGNAVWDGERIVAKTRALFPNLEVIVQGPHTSWTFFDTDILSFTTHKTSSETAS